MLSRRSNSVIIFLSGVLTGAILIPDFGGRIQSPLRGVMTEQQSRDPLSGGDRLELGRAAREEAASKKADEQKRAALREEAFAKLREEEDKRPPRFRLIGPDGHLTTRALEIAGLSEDEAQRVDQALHQAWQGACEQFASRAVLDPDVSNPDEGRYVYRVRAAADRGQPARDELNRKLQEIAGQDKAKILSYGLGAEDNLANFGDHDVRLEMDTRAGSYRFEYIDPDTGKVGASGSATLGTFEQQFGNSFEIGKVATPGFAPSTPR